MAALSIVEDPHNEADYVVRIGKRQIEVTFAINDWLDARELLPIWVREALRPLRGGRDRTIVAGLCFFRGRPLRPYSKKGIPAAANNPDRSIAVIAVCVGGASCLVYKHSWDDRPVAPALRAFLSNPRVLFAGLDIDLDAAKLEAEWGAHVAKRAELDQLVEGAVGRDAARGLRRGKRGSGPGASSALRRMARLVLLGNTAEEVGEVPARVAEKDWGEMLDSHPMHDEKEPLMHACADAFLAWEIASSCLHKVKVADGNATNAGS